MKYWWAPFHYVIHQIGFETVHLVRGMESVDYSNNSM